MVYAYFSDAFRMKVEFYLKGNKIVRVVYKDVKGYRHFPPEQMRDLKKLVGKYKYEFVNDWITFAVKNQRVTK